MRINVAKLKSWLSKSTKFEPIWSNRSKDIYVFQFCYIYCTMSNLWRHNSNYSKQLVQLSYICKTRGTGVFSSFKVLNMKNLINRSINFSTQFSNNYVEMLCRTLTVTYHRTGMCNYGPWPHVALQTVFCSPPNSFFLPKYVGPLAKNAKLHLINRLLKLIVCCSY